ncbi:MAG: TonB-dependent receptor, partial [Bacteroidota bacterium]
NGNLALYAITQRNVLSGDPYDLENLIETGEQQSRGFEIDVSGYVQPNFQLLASYSFADTEVLEHGDPEFVGQRIGAAPKHSANFWGRYDFTDDNLKGLGIGLGLQHSGDKFSWYAYSADGRLLLPEYTLLDGAIYYRPVNSNLQLILKVNNITDKNYWAGALNQFRLAPGAPRHVLLTVTYKF